MTRANQRLDELLGELGQLPAKLRVNYVVKQLARLIDDAEVWRERAARLESAGDALAVGADIISPPFETEGRFILMRERINDWRVARAEKRELT